MSISQLHSYCDATLVQKHVQQPQITFDKTRKKAENILKMLMWDLFCFII